MNDLLRRAAVRGIVALATTGCGGGRPSAIPATGEVHYRGAPLADAQVAFIPNAGQGSASRGTTGPDGRFELGLYGPSDGAVAGEHLVTITKMAAPSSKTGDSYAILKSVIPEKYGGASSSPLKATVSPQGNNHFRFDLAD